MKILHFAVAAPLLLGGSNGLAQSGPDRFSRPSDGRDASVPQGHAPMVIVLPPPAPAASAGGMHGPAPGPFGVFSKSEFERLQTLVALQEEKIALREQRI
jgi:hypothetical protein